MTFSDFNSTNFSALLIGKWVHKKYIIARFSFNELQSITFTPLSCRWTLNILTAFLSRVIGLRLLRTNEGNPKQLAFEGDDDTGPYASTSNVTCDVINSHEL